MSAPLAIARGRAGLRPTAGRAARCRLRCLVEADAVLLAGLGWLASGCSPVPFFVARAVHARPAQFRVRVERHVLCLTSDSVALVSDVFHPRGPNRTPTVLVRLPYTHARGQVRAANLVARLWAARGYTVVMQGTRGRYESGGIFYPMRPERLDGIATLRWLTTRPWYDGRVGMWGGSYFGYTQWVLADQTAPGLDALMIQNASTRIHDMFFPGGAFSLESALYWALRSYSDTDAPPPLATLQRGFDGRPLIEADDRAGIAIPFFDDWASHPLNDDYWVQIDGSNRASRLVAPVLLQGGWFDAFLPGVLADYAEIQATGRSDVAGATRLMIGPWAHTYTVKLPKAKRARDYRVEALAPSLDWFDLHLAGRPVRHAGPAPVRIFVMGENVWRDEEAWPLRRARSTPYYLTSAGRAKGAAGDGKLTTEAPVSEEPADAFDYDPRAPVMTAGGAMLGPRAGSFPQNEVEQRGDVLVYTTAALDRDLEVTGIGSAVLYVSTTAPCTDFAAKLVDVHPDGTAYNVCDGLLRRRYEPAQSDRSEPTEITVGLWPTSMVFKQGHRMRLEVASSNFPRYDLNPNTGGAIATEIQVATARQRVAHGAAHPSRLILPVVPR